MIGMIAAVSRNGVIGKEGKLPFDYPEDLKHFKETTINKTIIMGRKTFESIGRPLPKRRNIVISSKKIDGVECYSSIKEAIDNCDIPQAAVPYEKQLLNMEPSIWLIGGASIYREGMSVVDQILLTITPDIIIGNDLVYFPWINPMYFRMNNQYYNNIGNDDLKVIQYIRV